jgi:hypothetical protein
MISDLGDKCGVHVYSGLSRCHAALYLILGLFYGTSTAALFIYLFMYFWVI